MKMINIYLDFELIKKGQRRRFISTPFPRKKLRSIRANFWDYISNFKSHVELESFDSATAIHKKLSISIAGNQNVDPFKS